MIFKKYNIDVAVLEVGLGGRLDAVNVIDADVSVITSIGIDHVDWLGDDVEIIAREKAGIMRKGQPSVVSIFKPPLSLLEHAKDTGVQLHQLGKDYLYQGLSNQYWQLNGADLHLAELPMPALKGGFQLQNASAAIMAVSLLKLERVQAEGIAKGLQQVQLAGRFEQVSDVPKVIVDVAHNEQSAKALHDILSENPVKGRNIAVVAMLADKAIDEVLNAVHSQIDHWVSAGLAVNRGLSAKKMAQAVRAVDASGRLSVCETVTDACQSAQELADENDRIIVFGSFYTVAEATQYFKYRHRH